MCEIFPRTKSCCCCCSLRIGMMLIGITTIMTGCILLSYFEYNPNYKVNIDQFRGTMNNATEFLSSPLTYTKQNGVLQFVLTGWTITSFILIIAGVCNIIAFVTNEVCFAEYFVCLSGLCIVVALLTALGMACDYWTKEGWLYGLYWVTCTYFYAAMLGYFMIVTNTYVECGDTIETC